MKNERPFLLVNINNTNTSFALANSRRLLRIVKVPTASVQDIPFTRAGISGIVLSSVVPGVAKRLRHVLPTRPLVVGADIDLGIGVRYPNKKQIGADRLANAVGVAELYGAPAIVVDFGTAVTFDILSARSEYVGGVIAPGLASVTDYLYQRTALLPRIKLAEPKSVIGKSTIAAMRVGAVVGYRGLVKEILHALKRERGMRRAVVVATGGYGDLIAKKIPEIEHVNPLLTLEGLRFIYLRNRH
ncbi:MAG TPA: type III pantothenate kinase [Verrucomicrobiae bacterium]|nr:type III pantothenate kinase [Verrucomicrobiae bacterium]